MSLEKINETSDSIAVGYPRNFVTSGLDAEREIHGFAMTTKLGVKVPYCYSSKKVDGLLEHKLDEGALETGTFPGMSGGGLFSGEKLIGLTLGRDWNCNYYLPLYLHKKWLTDIIQYCKSVTNQSEDEKIQLRNQVKQLLQKILGVSCQVESASSNVLRINLSTDDALVLAKHAMTLQSFGLLTKVFKEEGKISFALQHDLTTIVEKLSAAQKSKKILTSSHSAYFSPGLFFKTTKELFVKYDDVNPNVGNGRSI